MASSSAAGALPGMSQINELKTKLYDRCSEDEPDTVFRQEDLIFMNVIPDGDVMLLLTVTQKLCDEKLFKLVRDGQVGWMYRPVEDAAKYRGLTNEQEMVYSLVDDAGAEGIWSKTIKTRSGLHDTTMRQALKALETKRLISDMKNVQHPTRKMYIKSSIRPSDNATGGAWFTEGELDEEFIEAICEVLYNHIFAKSFYRSSSMGSAKKPIKRSKDRSKMSAEEIKASRDGAFESKIKTENEERAAKRQRLDTLLPLPPGYQGYPTLNELTLFIDNQKVATTPLTQDDIQRLLDVLILDKRIEKILSGADGFAYKALRKTVQEIEDGPSNGLTEAPCGRCPVFDLCEEGGPVGPSNCVYFRDWLAM